jgi:hypothetical protein
MFSTCREESAAHLRVEHPNIYPAVPSRVMAFISFIVINPDRAEALIAKR